MSRIVFRSDQQGITLPVVLLVLIAVAGLSMSAAMLASNAFLIHSYDERQGVLEAIADAGLEEARAWLNASPDLYPDSGYVVFEENAPVYDARGQVIPNVTRTTYIGPSGVTTGQYGVYGSIITVARDAGGAEVVRRREVTQESFARFAYFTDVEPSNIAFGGGDQIFGPVHTNDVLKIYDTKATFHGPVTTAKTISGRQYGTFRQGYEENVSRIPMPETAELNKLRNLAAQGSLVFTPPTLSSGAPMSHATMRIEFVTIGDYGFIKVYQSNDPRWVVADVPSNYNNQGMRDSHNCGHWHNNGRFYSARQHYLGQTAGQNDNWQASITNHGRCYLGGADELFGGEFRPVTTSPVAGRWLEWPGETPTFLLNSGRPDSAYLFPINREMNPGFKGVIFVEGTVAVSGVLRGHVTLAARGDIIIVDDLVYATDPGSPDRNCTDEDDRNDDILGLFAGNRVIVADNAINSPKRPRAGSQSGNNFVTLDDTPDEWIHATILALNEFTVANYNLSSTAWSSELCGGTTWGRGCLYLTGGVIQRTRGAVGAQRSGGGGYGYLKRYSYDECVLTSPPPFFPTTGHFSSGRSYEIDPNTFNVSDYFDQITAGS